MRIQDVRPVSIVRQAPESVEAIDAVSRSILLHDLLAGANRAISQDIAHRLSDLVVEPLRLKAELETLVGEDTWVHVAGPVENRSVFLGLGSLEGRIASLGAPLAQVARRRRLNVDIIPDELDGRLGTFRLTKEQRNRLTRPRVLIAALYHPENFPLPRFPLGISDLARALRDEWLGETMLLDMQLGETVESIVSKARHYRPEVIGVSATFGQYDLLDQLLSELHGLEIAPIIAIGGSLSVLVGDELLRKGKVDFVATGAGELTMVGLANHALGEITCTEIPDAAYWDEAASKLVRTGRTRNKAVPSMVPELDLLPATLDFSGVMQLESSRGCSYACSFCPREHKGMWAGESAEALTTILPSISAIFQRYPNVDRRIFLVDEEFVGYQEEELALGRCVAVSSQLASYGFRFETSSRIDQVYRPRRDKAWHLNRMRFWQELTKIGLERCLFGVESGVDSILERFNKKTLGQQNVRALRLVSLLAVPVRCTYITFDPLMTLDELGKTLAFLGRTDLLLRPFSGKEDDQNLSRIYDIACDDTLSSERDQGIPFYHCVSYMGVSMEALIGSKYLQAVEDAGLAGEFNPLMGRREASYRDPRIGRLSELSQYWVDRNFSLDYALKSLEKCTSPESRRAIRDLRVALKESCFTFINMGYCAIRDGVDGWFGEDALERELETLKQRLDPLIQRASATLPEKYLGILERSHNEWRERTGWRLINGACTT